MSGTAPLTTTMALLMQLPPEILHNILGHVEAEDIGSVRRVCRYLFAFVEGNKPLFRDIYCRILVCTLA